MFMVCIGHLNGQVFKIWKKIPRPNFLLRCNNQPEVTWVLLSISRFIFSNTNIKLGPLALSC